MIPILNSDLLIFALSIKSQCGCILLSNKICDKKLYELQISDLRTMKLISGTYFCLAEAPVFLKYLGIPSKISVPYSATDYFEIIGTRRNEFMEMVQRNQLSFTKIFT